MLRRHGIDLAAKRIHFCVQHREKHPPTLIQNGSVETALLTDVFAGLLNSTFRLGNYVPDEGGIRKSGIGQSKRLNFKEFVLRGHALNFRLSC